MLQQEVHAYWSEAPSVPFLGAQVEQETCISLKSKGCWNPRTELKTDREYGFGLSQLTVTDKFNNFTAAKGWDKSLADWQWEDRYNPKYQLRALVIYMRDLSSKIIGASTPADRYAFTLSAYNGGFGGVLKDRALCNATPGCDSSKWKGNVANVSFRSKTAVKGYAQSFFGINRGYVVNVMEIRYKKYEGL
jgi:hypothetical protein